MPPNLDSPSGTLENSSNAPIRWDQLEQTLRRLQRDTLKIKKRNEAVLNTLQREKKSKGTFELLGQRQEKRDDNESSATGEPSKPSRTAKFLPEVSEVLRQSEEMKKRMQEERRKNEEHLGRMRAEGDILSDSLKRFKLSGPTETPNYVASVSSDGLKQYKATFNLLNGVKSSFNKAMDRLNYGKNESGSGGAVLLTHREETGSPRDYQSHKREQPEEDAGLIADFTEGMGLVKTSTPKTKGRMPKPRVKVPEGNPNDTKKAGRPRAPPPPVPVERMTIETLKELYQNASEDDSTLSLKKPPVPKPRPDKQKPSTGGAEEVARDEESAVNSGLDESSSEFDFVVAPLKVETVEVTTDDSYESPKKNKGFAKNPQLKAKKLKETGSSVSAGSKLKARTTPSKPEKSPKKLPASPPAVFVDAVDSGDQTACHPIPTAQITSSSFETLEVPVTRVLETPPPPSEKEDDLENHLEENCIIAKPEEIPVASYASLKSSLIPGRRICPVDIELQPWKSNGKIYDIYVAPKTFAVYTLMKKVFPEEQTPIHDFVENDSSNDDKTDAVNTIARSFSFLEDAEIVEDQENVEEHEEIPDPPEELSEACVAPTPNEDLLRVNLEETARTLVDKEEVEEHIVITEIGKSTSYFRPEIDETVASYEETAIDDFQVEDAAIPEELEVESPPPPLPSSRPPFLEEFNKPVILEIVSLPLPTKTEQELLIKPAEREEESSRGGGGPPPPPVMPEIPLFCSSSVGKAHKVLPVTPIDHTYLGDSIFFTLRLDVEGDNEQLQTELRMIEGQFNKSAAEVENSVDVKLAEAPISPIQSSSVSLLSQKRRNAVAICAKRLNHLSATRIMSGLKELNTKVFTADDLQILTQIMPKDDEKSIFETVDGSKSDSLCKEDHFLKQLSEIPRCSQKLDVMNFILGFDETIQTLETDIGILESATESVKQSTKFPKILEVILLIINKAFVKNDDERVKAFEIHSLTKLGSKKSTDGKGSLLNFIVKCVETNFPDALNFYQDFKHVEEAARISKDECIALLKETEKGLQSVRDEIDTVQMNGENLDYSDGVSDVISFVIQATKSVDRIIRRWESAIKQLKQLMAYLALSSSEECNIKEFFGLISKFIGDFKHAVSQNKRIFPTATKKTSNATDSSLALRRSNRLSLGPNEFAAASRSSESSVAARRQSLGNFTSSTSALQQMKEETGQPSEFIDALVVFGQKTSNEVSKESEQCKIRRRASLYTPYPYRKRYHETTSDNRERQ